MQHNIQLQMHEKISMHDTWILKTTSMNSTEQKKKLFGFSLDLLILILISLACQEEYKYLRSSLEQNKQLCYIQALECRLWSYSEYQECI